MENERNTTHMSHHCHIIDKSVKLSNLMVTKKISKKCKIGGPKWLFLKWRD